MGILQLEEQPAIIQAIFAGIIDEVKELIEYKQDVNCLDEEKRTPLHAAAYRGETAICSLLLQNGAKVNAKDSKWVTPLHRACSVGADGVVQLLLSYQADVSARNKLWQTPLHIAAACDAYSCVEQILHHVPNQNVRDRSGRSALHYAAYNGHTSICELLISRNCMVNACDKRDYRPLHCSVQMGHTDTAELLIKYGADVNAKDRNQYTPLHVAAASDVESVCRLLINSGADVNAQNVYGNTPLHIACLNGQSNIVQDLLDSAANKNATNFRGQTPLHIAAASTHGMDCLLVLLIYDVDINYQSLDGRTALHMTAIHGKFMRSKSLIDYGAHIDVPDKNGCTPLHIAAQYGHDILANTLLNFGANPLSKGSYECLDLLVSNGANFRLTDNLLRLPIHYAASQGHYQCVFTLVGIGSPVNDVDIEGCTPLHLAAAYDHDSKCVDYLLDHKADRNMKDNRGFTPLHYAIAGGNINGVRRLLKNEQTATEKKEEGDEIKKMMAKCSVDITPLHLAAKLGNLEILKMVMPFFPDVNIRTNQGITPLLLAAREGHAQCVHFLLHFGAKVAVADYINNMTPVHYSAKNGHSQCLSLLLHNSEDENVVNMLDRQHRTALMLAVSGNNLKCVHTLLKFGADPNIVDTDDHSCLFRAVVSGQDGVVELLLSSNATVQTTDINGKTVLHLAAACGHLNCMQMILNYMSEEQVRAKDKQECTALHWACYHGYANCVEYLLEKKIFKELEENSFSPIHCATFSGSDKCLELLVNYFGKQIVNLSDRRKRTPLHIAALHGHAECAKYLIEQGANIEVSDEEGRTPFIAAAQYGQTQIVEHLLTCKIDPTTCDRLGNTALHWACLKKHNQTALLILEDCEGDTVVNIANKDKKTPLHISARNGLVDITRELLKKGASVVAVDNEGMTPALSCAPNINVARCLALIFQTFPSINTGEGDLPNQPCPYQIFSLTKETKDEYCQASIPEQQFKYPVKKCIPNTQRKNPVHIITEENSDCFIKENEDVSDTPVDTTPEKLGTNLHKSQSCMSLINSKELKLTSYKRKPCRECLKLQHKCQECSLKLNLKRHLIGKTSREDFQNFIAKCLTESTPEYQLLFNSSLESVGRELGLEERIFKFDKSKPSYYQRMLINRHKLHAAAKKNKTNKSEISTKSEFFLKNDPVITQLIQNYINAVRDNSGHFSGQSCTDEKSNALKSSVSQPIIQANEKHTKLEKNRSETHIGISKQMDFDDTHKSMEKMFSSLEAEYSLLQRKKSKAEAACCII
ncbi:serine/threonine-protein phosphatase 6 regulatory ankyrin repeat subunit A-like isoform X2 [Diorhabda carinulata]|uniref:serine/threonine-protein phosphatase 6 regulatory ankyrin repeat subunit A-like isoform X2 n=1 Tax=Diorhabda carinulata TaxID=1163345 RepID=UPI0025A029E5|nr:serine/threonine-protein phosphatase 6 regulatory ankyrin repeat subunit A-like isoform X2 [Diorhabda carinulata]